MTSPISSSTTLDNLADLLDYLGGIAPERVRLKPPPGTATEADLIAMPKGQGRFCELVEGTLVEKAVGYFEARLAAVLIYFLEEYLSRNDVGVVAGADALMRLGPGLVREPDVSFLSWSRLPGRRVPRGPIADLAPDLAVEVLSKSNTAKEIGRKRDEYFAAGTQLLWCIDPDTSTVAVWTTPESETILDENQTLDGGTLLPGFALSIRTLFARAAGER